MLALTDSAVDAVRRVIVSADEEMGLRIAVESGGCSGLKYKMELVTDPQDTDLVLEISGLKVFLDASSVEKLAGTEVDFVEEVDSAGFVFNNPNAKSNCGCGKSFC